MESVAPSGVDILVTASTHAHRVSTSGVLYDPNFSSDCRVFGSLDLTHHSQYFEVVTSAYIKRFIVVRY